MLVQGQTLSIPVKRSFVRCAVRGHDRRLRVRGLGTLTYIRNVQLNKQLVIHSKSVAYDTEKEHIIQMPYGSASSPTG